MTRKTAKLLTYGQDSHCDEMIKFIEDGGVRLHVRDIEKEPLSEEEIWRLIGYCDINHFLNPLSPAYEKNGLDARPKDRARIIKLVAEDHTLLRKPIICTSRLITIGCDKRTLVDVLQLGLRPNAKIPDIGNRVNVRARSSRGSRTQAYSGK
jgi:arsenate reductase-like glutaredoxin family protein